MATLPKPFNRLTTSRSRIAQNRTGPSPLPSTLPVQNMPLPGATAPRQLDTRPPQIPTQQPRLTPGSYERAPRPDLSQGQLTELNTRLGTARLPEAARNNMEPYSMEQARLPGQQQYEPFQPKPPAAPTDYGQARTRDEQRARREGVYAGGEYFGGPGTRPAPPEEPEATTSSVAGLTRAGPSPQEVVEAKERQRDAALRGERAEPRTSEIWSREEQNRVLDRISVMQTRNQIDAGQAQFMRDALATAIESDTPWAFEEVLLAAQAFDEGRISLAALRTKIREAMSTTRQAEQQPSQYGTTSEQALYAADPQRPRTQEELDALDAETQKGLAYDSKTGQVTESAYLTEEEKQERQQRIRSMNIADSATGRIFGETIQSGPGDQMGVERAGGIIVVDEDPDSTEQAVTLKFGKDGRPFNALNPEEYPPEFVAWLESLGTTPADFAASTADKWLNQYRPGLSDKQRAEERAVLMYGREAGFFIDDDNGIVDIGGNQATVQWSMFQTERELAKGDYPPGAEGDLARAIDNNLAEVGLGVSSEVQARRAAERGVGEDTKFASIGRIEESLQRLQAEADIDPEPFIKESRQSFQMQQAKNLRTNLNRMARAGSSPEAIQGTTAQMAQEAEQQQQQLETLTRLQIEQGNVNRRLAAINQEINVMTQLYSQQSAQEFTAEQNKYMRWLNMQQQALMAQQQYNANKIDPLQMALGIGVSVLGTGVGALTGGLGLGAAGAIFPALMGGASSAAGSSVQKQAVNRTQLLPATGGPLVGFNPSNVG